MENLPQEITDLLDTYGGDAWEWESTDRATLEAAIAKAIAEAAEEARIDERSKVPPSPQEIWWNS